LSDKDPDRWRLGRYKQAYLEMAKRTKYRPGAPSDGMGHIQMSAEQLRDPAILDREANRYAIGFVHQDDEMEYPMGCPDGGVNKGFFYAIEAARLPCSDYHARPFARELLKMSIEEIDAAISGAKQ
jgi:hypothetical protein